MWQDQPGKGHEALIRGWPRVCREVPGAELWIVGTGDNVPLLEALAKDCGVEKAVQFLGRVPDRQLSKLYSEASVFAMPSRQEGFGLVYLEAMWHGLPCIASTADAARHVVDASSGILVEYGDAEQTASAVTSLIANPALAAKLGEGARRRVLENFSFDSFNRRLLSVLQIEGS